MKVIQIHQLNEIGDTIELLSPSDDKITDIVKTSSFKIVGFVESPQYIAFDKGITQVGDDQF